MQKGWAKWQLILAVAVVAGGFSLLFGVQKKTASNFTLSVARTFVSLDGSPDDDDGIFNGIFTIYCRLYHCTIHWPWAWRCNL